MIKQFFKKVLISYLIIICCIFTPTYNAYAASAGGWSFNRYDVATSVVTALKGGVSASVTVAKSPISAKIAKGILGGVIAGAALPLAISQITGIAMSALDWVLDPANNAIKYTPKPNTFGYATTYDTKVIFATAQAAADYACKPFQGVDSIYQKTNPEGTTVFATVGSVYCNYGNSHDLRWQPYPTTPVSIPISTVADKIYDNAKSDSDSRSVVNDAVKDYVNEGSADAALDAAKADADATHGCGTGTHWSGSACVADTPSTPTTPTTPDTPFDPSSILDAIGKVFDAVMSLPDVINNALDDLLADIKDFFQPVIDLVTDFFDWFKDKFTALYDAITGFFEWVKTEPTPVQAEPVDIQTPELPQMESTDITFGGQCPQNFDIDIDLFGKPVKFTLFDSSVFCQFLSDWIRIPVIFAASLTAVYILGGRRSD